MSRKSTLYSSMVDSSCYLGLDHRYQFEYSLPEQSINEEFGLPLSQRLMDAVRDSFSRIELWIRTRHVMGVDVYVTTLSSNKTYEFWLELDHEENIEWVVVHRYPSVKGDERFPVWTLTLMSEYIHRLDYTPMTIRLPDIEKTRARCQYLALLHWTDVRAQILELTSTPEDSRLRYAYHLLETFNPDETPGIKETQE